MQRVRYYLARPQYRTLTLYRLAKACRIRGLRWLLWRAYQRAAFRSGIEIFTDDLGGGVIFPHWGRILLHARAIGSNLYIFHNVTVGDDYKTGIPRIGDNVFIGANSTILGNIDIGDDVIVGAGTVLKTDVPRGSVVTGNPGAIVRQVREGEIREMLGY